MDITGIWVGTAIYGDGYEKIAGRRNDFMLTIIETDGEITGSLIDQECVFVFKSAIPITGFLNDETISFTRNYPYYYYSSEKPGHFYVNKKSPPYEVLYSGDYNAEKAYFVGSWELATNVVKTGTVYEKEQGFGHWVMRRPTEEDFVIFRNLMDEAGLPFDF
jgi:hypothetical protein